MEMFSGFLEKFLILIFRSINTEVSESTEKSEEENEQQTSLKEYFSRLTKSFFSNTGIVILY